MMKPDHLLTSNTAKVSQGIDQRTYCAFVYLYVWINKASCLFLFMLEPASCMAAHVIAHVTHSVYLV